MPKEQIIQLKTSKLMSCLFQEGEHGLDEHKLHMYLSALQSLIPSLFALVLQNAPFTSKAKLQGEVPQIEGKWLISDLWIFSYQSALANS